MKKHLMTGLLISALAIGGAAFAAPVDEMDELVQPRPVQTGYQTVVKDLNSTEATSLMWIAASDVKSYYMALRDVTVAFPNPETDIYQLNIREVPTMYYVRDNLIPAREDAGLSVEGYDQYAYSVATYRIQIVRTAGVERQVLNPAWAWKNNQYHVAKVAQKDYTEDGRLLGERNIDEDLVKAEPGSDYYALATGVDRKIYNYRPAGR